MKNSMPIGEINVDQIIQNAKRSEEELLEKRKNLFKEKIKKINETSLNKLANNTNSYGKSIPILLDFGTLLNKIKSDFIVDNDNESLQVKIDIINQLLKMKNVPSFSEECHIESNNKERCISLYSLILKKLFRQKKYRIVFHNKEATFSKEYHDKLGIKPRLFLLTCTEIAIFVVSLIISSNILFYISIFLMIINLLLLVD